MAMKVKGSMNHHNNKIIIKITAIERNYSLRNYQKTVLPSENLGRTRQNEVPQTKVEPVLNPVLKNKSSKDVQIQRHLFKLNEQAKSNLQIDGFNEHRDALLKSVETICKEKGKYADFVNYIHANTDIIENNPKKEHFFNLEHLDVIDKWLIKNNASLNAVAA